MMEMFVYFVLYNYRALYCNRFNVIILSCTKNYLKWVDLVHRKICTNEIDPLYSITIIVPKKYPTINLACCQLATLHTITHTAIVHTVYIYIE